MNVTFVEGRGLSKRDALVARSVEFCRPCGGGTPPVLMEAMRYNFALTQHLGGNAWGVFRQVVLMTKAEFRKFGDMVGFYAPKDKVQHVLKMFETVGFHVHSLEEHVDFLKFRYTGQPQEFGPLRFVELPLGEGWQVYDPDSRDFVFLPTFQTAQGRGANVKEKSVLRCLVGGGPVFYRFSGINAEGRQVIHRVERRAANNLVVPLLRSIPAYWVPHPELGLAVVPAAELAYLPDEVFDTLKRLNPLPKSVDDLYITDLSDFEIVKTLLGYVKIDLKPGIEVVRLPFQKDKLHGSPVMPLSDIHPVKLDAFLQTLCSASGATSERDAHSVRILYDGTSLPIFFVHGEHGSGMEGKLYVAVSNVTSPEKVVFMIQQLAPQLGFRISDVEARRRLVCSWPTDEPSDAAFCLTVLLENLDDEAFVKNFLGSQPHAALATEWYKEMASKEDLGAGLMDKARTIGRHLGTLPDQRTPRSVADK